jgi:hypothetical protein
MRHWIFLKIIFCDNLDTAGRKKRQKPACLAGKQNQYSMGSGEMKPAANGSRQRFISGGV